MKNIFRILVVALFFVSCQHKITPSDVSKINGYWEIKKVVAEGEKDKEYGINESFDYFQLDKSNTGFRTKVMPQLDGTFLTNNIKEKVSVRFDGDKVYLDYSTPYNKWSEELVAVSDDELVTLNTEKKEYHYKKTGPINLLGDGKKTK